MRELTRVEERLRAAAVGGDELDLRGQEDRTVRAEVVRDLLLGPVDPRGLRLRGAVVAGTLDLDGLRTPVRLRVRHCELQGITMRGATVPLLDLSGCSVTALLADDLVVDGTVLLRHPFTATGLVSLTGARIGGKLDLAGARLSGGRGAALVADRAVIAGDLLLDGAEVSGGAADGALQLTGTRVAGRLSARRLRATNPAGPALGAANLQVTDTVDLSRGAELRGYGDRGAVRLVGARIGSLSLGEATLHNPAGWALAAHYLDAVGTVYLDRMTATGGLRLSGSRIGGRLDCGGSTVETGAGPALDATRASMAQGIDLRGATMRGRGDGPGTVALRGLNCGGDLDLRDSRLANPDGVALRAAQASVGGITWLEPAELESGGVDLRDAHLGVLRDSTLRLPAGAPQMLDGLTYLGIPGSSGGTPPPVEARLTWLGGMGRYAAQPYRQLAAAYQAVGHEDDARRVLVAQQERLTGSLAGWTRLRHRLFGATLQYGYQPVRAVLLLGVVLMAAVGLFLGFSGGSRTPAGAACPWVDRAGLAVDAAVPLVSTGAGDRCAPATGTGTGQALALAGWGLGALGWASATLVVAGYSGLVRRR